MKTGILPGSFDPVTLGHVDLVRRAAGLCDRLLVAVLVNDEKRALFTPRERVGLLRAACPPLPGLEILTFEGLLVDFAARHGATLVFRGVRHCRDLENETVLAASNRAMMPSLETVFLPALDGLGHISSTLVRQIASLGGDTSPFVPPCAVRALRDKFPALHRTGGKQDVQE